MNPAVEIYANLDANLSAENVSIREGRFHYVEAHHVIREANRIFGFDGWTRETRDINQVQHEQKDSQRGGKLWYVAYTARSIVMATFDGVSAVREGVGFGQGIDLDVGRAHESAIKEAETDAMKRALMTFGDPFGLALYDKQREHVDYDDSQQQRNAPRNAPQRDSGREYPADDQSRAPAQNRDTAGDEKVLRDFYLSAQAQGFDRDAVHAFTARETMKGSTSTERNTWLREMAAEKRRKQGAGE